MTKPILAAMLSCEGLTLTEEEKKLFAEYNPLGVSLFARNFKSKQQAKNLIDEIRETIGPVSYTHLAARMLGAILTMVFSRYLFRPLYGGKLNLE